MPLCPQVTITPITVTTTGMSTTSIIAASNPATTEQLTEVSSDAAQAQADAAAALSAANTAYTTAVNSLQPSAYAIQNPTTKQLSAIDATGLTVYVNSPTTGARVVMNSLGLAGYNSSGSATFSISASTGAAVFSGSVTGSTITGGTLNIGGNAIINSSGYLTATGATITGTIYASSGTIGGFTIQSTYLSGSDGFTLYSNGTIDGGNSNTIFYGYANIGGGFPSGARFQVNGNSEFTGNTIATGSVTAQGELYAAGHSTTTNTANGYVFQTGGRIARFSSSSERYKENITDILDVPGLDPKNLLNIPIRAFSYKDGYIPETDDRYMQMIPGFIAEEVDKFYPIAADYVDGVESINDRMILAGALALIQDLYKEIAIIKGE